MIILNTKVFYFCQVILIIPDPVAVKRLGDAINWFVLYNCHEDFVHALKVFMCNQWRSYLLIYCIPKKLGGLGGP